MVLAQREKYRLVEQNRKSGDKSHTLYLTGGKKYTLKQRQPLQQVVLGKQVVKECN